MPELSKGSLLHTGIQEYLEDPERKIQEAQREGSRSPRRQREVSRSPRRQRNNDGGGDDRRSPQRDERSQAASSCQNPGPSQSEHHKDFEAILSCFEDWLGTERGYEARVRVGDPDAMRDYPMPGGVGRGVRLGLRLWDRDLGSAK